MAARELLLKALELDHRLSSAYVELAWIERSLITTLRNMVSDERADQAKRRAIDYAKTAVERDPVLSEARSAYGHMLTHLDDLELAIAQNQEAVRLNPSDAAARSELGATLCTVKKFDASLAALAMAKRLSPNDPGMWRFLSLESCALLGLERYDEAIRVLRRAQELRPNYLLGYVNEIVALSKAGRPDDAQVRLNHLRGRFPDLSLDALSKSGSSAITVHRGLYRGPGAPRLGSRTA